MPCPDYSDEEHSSFMYMTGVIGGYGLTFFLPIILKDSLEFSEELAFLLTAPPALFAVLCGLIFSWIADKTRVRGPYIVMEGILGLVGFCMLGFLEIIGRDTLVS